MKRRFLFQSRVLVSVLVFCMLTHFLPGSVQAFKPNDAGHLGITQEALIATTRVVGSETLKFSQRAIKQIRDANKDTDCLSCQANASFHVDDEAFAATTSRLVQLKTSVINKITASSPDGASARQDLGGALHTLQDFYAHTNWVELGNTGIDSRLGRSTYGGLPLSVASCPTDAGILGGSGLTSLTSGWFKIPLCVPPAGKCRHGISIPFLPDPCPTGLNKDDASRPGYTSARALAVDATKDFLNQILDDPLVAGNAKAIKALMDVKSTLGMVIDTTGSMGGIIGQVKTQVAQIVNSVRDTDNAPAQYLLQSFSDPDVGTTFVTQDPDAFLAAVNSLFASGGGDCPELSQTGLLRAIAASLPDATLYLFTDASAKDSSLAGNVIAAAQAKRIQLNYPLFGSCSPIDPAYIQGAAATGGQVFMLNGSEAGLIFNLIRPQLPGNLSPIMSVRGALASGTQSFDVPIDSTVESATFSVAIDSKGPIALFRPSGAAVVGSDAGVTITELTSGRFVTVNSPETGNWRLQVAGTGAFSAQALANSSIQLNSFQFVELTGRPDHEGLFPIAGQPLVNSEQKALASLLGVVNTTQFKLLSDNGSLIQSISLAQNHPDAAADEYVGDLVLPVQPFRVAVTGLDATGLPYQRLFPTLFRAQSLGVSISDGSNIPSLIAGTTTTLTFVVQNLGSTNTFRIIAADNRGFVSRVEPTLLNLAGGASASVAVDLTVPAGTPDGTDVSLTVTAGSNTDPNILNSVSVRLTVISNRPPDCSLARPSIASLWPANHKLHEIAILGVTDPDGDTVTIQIDSITQDEPTKGGGDGDTCPDAFGLGTSIAQIRAERSGKGNGRVYTITFTATDGKGGSCQSSVKVSVPHSQGTPAIDNNSPFNSVLCGP